MRPSRSIDGLFRDGFACACALALMACAGSTSVNNGGKDGSVTGAGGGSGGATVTGQGGTATGTGGAGVTGAGGVRTGAGGSASGAGGSPTTGTDGGATSGCTVGAWPAADPSVTGPFATTTENNVGPAAGQGADGGAPVAFTLFRPTDLAQGGLCHPVITWGNGTGTTPSIYRVLLTHLASHRFVVIASNSPNVAQGTPPPMVAGVTWVLQQNADPTSVMYQRIDTAHVGATGHSQGGFATTTAGQDSHVLTIAPIAGATATRNLHGPALLLCGGMDTTVPCSTIMNAFTGITNQPVMLADQLAATHGGWVSFRAGTLNPYEVAVTAWMRVQLMGDTSLRSMFYGPTCTLCTNTAVWSVMQKMMDQ
jgi:hypothetical protein